MSQETAHTVTKQSKALKCADTKQSLCFSCGRAPLPKRRRRYCSDKCKKRLDFALYVAAGLVQALRARYAAFSYTEDTIILDILPVGSNVISRFMWNRSKHGKVADDLLGLIEQVGCEWYEKEDKARSRWWATQQLLDETLRGDIPARTIRPISRKAPQFNHKERTALRLLELTKEEILSKDGHRCIKSAYRKKAKLHHPDKGDKSKKFLEINAAHAELLNWAERPRFHRRAALPNSWCYDSSRKRWVPPA